ncbi:MAG: HAD family hydrolase [Stellaceae bacterium]
MGTVVVFDLDGTITRGDTFLAYLIHVLVRRPERVPRCLGLIAAAVRFASGSGGREMLKGATLTAVVGGMRRDEAVQLADDFVERRLPRMIKPAALTRIAWHRRRGHRLILATASVDLYAAAIAKRLGFTDAVCTRAVWCNDTVAGGLDGPNLRGEAKLAALRGALDDIRSPRTTLIAYSDHHSDLPLLRFADRGIAVDPTRRLADCAAALGLPVERWRDGGPESLDLVPAALLNGRR